MLKDYSSSCEKKQKIIVSRDPGARPFHKAYNVDNNNVRHYKIDGYVIKDFETKKCDFLLMNDTKKTAYLIELKGTDIKTAIQQLERTEEILKEDLKDYRKNYRIVYCANTHGIRSSEYTKFCIRHKGFVTAQTNRMEENI